MAIVITSWQLKKEQPDRVALQCLPKDMKRLLTVQIKEFVHEVEDCEQLEMEALRREDFDHL